MSRRNKLEKFAELLTFPNVYQNYSFKDPVLRGAGGKVEDLKGQWCRDHFGNNHELVLELACGGGEYTIDLARMYADRNFLGVDIKGNRIWKGARKGLEEELSNAAFLRTRIEQLDEFIGAGEVSEIWITFPDPFLRKSKANRRLTAPRFLKMYRQLLVPGGVVHLKTDSPELYEFTLEVLKECDFCRLQYAADDIYRESLPLPELAIKTYYEKMHLADGKSIKYVRIGFDPLGRC